jgi:hypothetical protein
MTAEREVTNRRAGGKIMKEVTDIFISGEGVMDEGKSITLL